MRRRSRRRRTTVIKSNNPHLAGGEKQTFCQHALAHVKYYGRNMWAIRCRQDGSHKWLQMFMKRLIFTELLPHVLLIPLTSYTMLHLTCPTKGFGQIGQTMASVPWMGRELNSLARMQGEAN
jgi:hypothetical protein